MNALEKLIACAGAWRGDNRLYESPDGPSHDSPSTATVTPILGGRFVRMSYTWAYQGQPKEGELLIGYEAKSGAATAHWVDSWHMSDKAMACRGAVGPDGAIDVRGTYAAPPGPDWGWRIVLKPDDGRRQSQAARWRRRWEGWRGRGTEGREARRQVGRWARPRGMAISRLRVSTWGASSPL
jgi:hypothetical protein